MQPKDVVDAYLDAINAHDYEAARRYLADTGFVYQSPIARFDSADACMEHFAMAMGILQRIERVKTFVDGPDVCSILIVHIQLSSKEQIRFVNWARVVNGRIQSIEAVFDARIYQTLFLPPDGIA